MAYSYKDGYREGVIFLFYKDGRILIEHRPKEDGGIETFIPNGSIEDKDHGQELDYKLVALHREVYEEFQGKVKVNNCKKISEYKVDEIKIIFYTYVVDDWDGEIPEYTIEDGEKFADLELVRLDDFRNYLKLDSAVDACLALKNYLVNKDKGDDPKI
jgi:8-oxo-dGTP pyrophosphatase MutT (NUDIX family)